VGTVFCVNLRGFLIIFSDVFADKRVCRKFFTDMLTEFGVSVIVFSEGIL
jgi:hypothetical protein